MNIIDTVGFILKNIALKRYFCQFYSWDSHYLQYKIRENVSVNYLCENTKYD